MENLAAKPATSGGEIAGPCAMRTVMLQAREQPRHYRGWGLFRSRSLYQG
jgi:hypothetical protein